MINVLVNGCDGKMGNILVNYIENSVPDMCVKYKIDKNSECSFDEIEKNLNKFDDEKCNMNFIKPDVIIDFSTPNGTFLALDFAAKNLLPVVIATTGFSKEQEDKIKEYSEAIPIFKSANMSYSINFIADLLKNIAPFVSDMDIEILEKHHNKKKDSPSGTALLLADSINSVSGNKYEYCFDRCLKNTKRSKNEIGFSSIRGGNLVGEHSVFFFGEYESIEIKHTSYSRIIYAEGAVLGARFIIHKKSGLYDMTDLKNMF